MNIVCTICARGGSKGVKNKNLRALRGRPLIAFTVMQALESRIFSSIAVSSDSEAILAAVSEYESVLQIVRPPELASDVAAKMPAIRHAMLEVERLTSQQVDILIDLDATSPLRSVEDICNVVQIVQRPEVHNVVTGTPSRRSPYFNMVERVPSGIKLCCPTTIVRRQDAPPTFDLNASIYAWKRDVLLEENSLFGSGTELYEMPLERSWDIDDELDFEIVEFFMSQRHNSKRLSGATVR